MTINLIFPFNWVKCHARHLNIVKLFSFFLSLTFLNCVQHFTHSPLLSPKKNQLGDNSLDIMKARNHNLMGKKWFPVLIFQSTISKYLLVMNIGVFVFVFVYEIKLKSTSYQRLSAQWILIVSDELIIGTRKVLYRHHGLILFEETSGPCDGRVRQENDHQSYMLINRPSTIENLVYGSTIPATNERKCEMRNAIDSVTNWMEIHLKLEHSQRIHKSIKYRTSAIRPIQCMFGEEWKCVVCDIVGNIMRWIYPRHP